VAAPCACAGSGCLVHPASTSRWPRPGCSRRGYDTSSVSRSGAEAAEHFCSRSREPPLNVLARTTEGAGATAEAAASHSQYALANARLLSGTRAKSILPSVCLFVFYTSRTPRTSPVDRCFPQPLTHTLALNLPEHASQGARRARAPRGATCVVCLPSSLEPLPSGISRWPVVSSPEHAVRVRRVRRRRRQRQRRQRGRGRAFDRFMQVRWA
jgi:hypothetical protein